MDIIQNQSNPEEPIKFYYEYKKYGQFSNFYESKITIDGKEWPTTEHYFQAQKFKGINEEFLEKVKLVKTPGDAKELARSGGIKRRSDWGKVRYEVMKVALRAKFTQHEELKRMLLDTRDRELIESTKDDYTWGCGLDGTGKNLLGKALMEVREELRKEK